MMYWISDTHFNHEKVIEYCNRPYKNVEQMNEGIIYTINRIVNISDTLVFLGDFGFKGDSSLQEILNRINGRKILVKGNHDHEHVTKLSGWDSIHDIFEYKEMISVKSCHIVGCHYPMLHWNRSHYGSYHFHGHMHGRELPVSKGWMGLDVGIDSLKIPVSTKNAIERIENIDSLRI